MTLNPETFTPGQLADQFARQAMGDASLVLRSGFNAARAVTGDQSLDLVTDGDLLGVTVARANRAWNPNWDGINGSRVGRLVEYGPNQVRSGRFGILKETAAATNLVQNPRGEGAAVGTLTGGSPTGALPTRWALDAQGATVEFVGYAVTEGRTEALFRFSGTPTGDPILYVEPAATAAAAVNGNERAGQLTVRLAAGSLTGIAGVAARIQELTSAGADVAGGSGTFFAPDASQRNAVHSRTLSGGGTVARARHGLIIDHTGGAIDVTLAVSVADFKSGLTASTPVLPPALEPGESTRAAETFTTGLTTTRASRATYLDSNGVLRHYLPNTLRDGVDGKLHEEGSTNLWTRSEEINDSAWTKTDATVTANVAGAPDGSLTMDRVTMGAATGGFTGVNRTLSITSGQPYTFSFFVAPEAGVRWVQITLASAALGTGVANFDLLTGEVAFQTAGTSTGYKASIRRAGRGWRIAVTANALATGSGVLWLHPVPAFNSARGSSFTGTGAETFLIWGGQAENKAFPTSYIRTAASTVSRAEDNIQLLASPAIRENQPFTLLCDFVYRGKGTGGFGRVVSVGVSTTNQVRIAAGEDGGNFSLSVSQGGSGLFFIVLSELIEGKRYRIVAVINPGAHSLHVNGALVGTDSNATALALGTGWRVALARDADGGNAARANAYSDVRYIPRALTAAQALELSKL